MLSVISNLVLHKASMLILSSTNQILHTIALTVMYVYSLASDLIKRIAEISNDLLSFNVTHLRTVTPMSISDGIMVCKV